MPEYSASQKYGPFDERRTATYRHYLRMYREAQALYDFMFERWRNDLATYTRIESVVQDSRYGIHVVNA